MKEQKFGEIVIYKRKNGGADIQVTLKDESLWLNQHQLANLFSTDRTSILRHIKNIYLKPIAAYCALPWLCPVNTAPMRI